MKKIYAAFLFIFVSAIAFAQKEIPEIKTGTKLTYMVASRASGQTANINLTIVSLKDTVKIKWDIPFVGGGSFAIPPKAMQSGTKLIVTEPQVDEVTRMNDDETLVFLSKDTYVSLVNTKTFVLNGFTFNVKPDTGVFKIKDTPVDVFYAVSIKGNREIWILNNPVLPIICRSRRATKAIDFELQSLTN